METLFNSNLFITKTNTFIQSENTLYILENNKLNKIKLPINEINKLIIQENSNLILYGNESLKNSIIIGNYKNKTYNWNQIQLGTDTNSEIIAIVEDKDNIFIITHNNENKKGLKLYKNEKFYTIKPYYQEDDFDITFSNDGEFTIYQPRHLNLRIEKDQFQECDLLIYFVIEDLNIESNKKVIYPKYIINEVIISNKKFYPVSLTGSEFSELTDSSLKDIIGDRYQEINEIQNSSDIEYPSYTDNIENNKYESNYTNTYKIQSNESPASLNTAYLERTKNNLKKIQSFNATEINPGNIYKNEIFSGDPS